MLASITARPVASIGDANARCGPTFLSRKRSAPYKSDDVSNKEPFEDRITAFANAVFQEAETLPPLERDVLLRKVQKARAAKEMDAWANSPGPRPR
jgi:hypothetical protein